jgi:hypothetical protein
MNGNGVRRLALVLIGIAALAIVGFVAYHAGTTTNDGSIRMPFGPMHVNRGYGWPGFGLFGLVAFIAIGLLAVWVVAALFSGAGGGIRPSVPPAGGDVERLRELAEMHDRGALTDDEFAAAKRKLLGM